MPRGTSLRTSGVKALKSRPFSARLNRLR